MSDERIEDLPNLDAEAARVLGEVGITTPAELAAAGSIGAFVACTEHFEERGEWETLFALEGALRGVDWQTIPEIDLQALQADAETALEMAEL